MVRNHDLTTDPIATGGAADAGVEAAAAAKDSQPTVNVSKGTIGGTVLHSLLYQTSYVKARKYWCRSLRSRLQRKVPGSLRTSLCPEGTSSICPRSSTSAFLVRSNRRMNARDCGRLSAG